MTKTHFAISTLLLSSLLFSKPSQSFAFSSPVQTIFIHNLQSRYDQIENTQQKLVSKIGQNLTKSPLSQIVLKKIQDYQTSKQLFQSNFTLYKQTPSFGTYLQLQSDLKQLRQSQLDLIKALSNKQQPPIQQPKKN